MAPAKAGSNPAEVAAFALSEGENRASWQYYWRECKARCSEPWFLKWVPWQQPQHHLGTCERCRFWGSHKPCFDTLYQVIQMQLRCENR